MDQFIAAKPVHENWSYFNQAVEARAAYLRDHVVPSAPIPPLSPPVDWLRRGLGIGAVIIGAGVACALVLWVLRPAAHSFWSPPSLPPSVPAAVAAVDYTKFVTVRLNDMSIVTGWNYKSSEDPSPVNQYCYVLISKTSVGSLKIDIANTERGVLPFDANDMAPLTLPEFQAALSKCVWAPNTTLPASRASDTKDHTHDHNKTLSEVGLLTHNGVKHVQGIAGRNTAILFVLDSGAGDVQIPLHEAQQLLQEGTLVMTGRSATFINADGAKTAEPIFILRSLTVGERIVTNIECTVTTDGDALLGQSFLNRVGSWSIDNARGVLVLGEPIS
jgi:hypothetical protein